MMRHLAIAVGLLILTGCAGPQNDAMLGADPAPTAETAEPVAAAPLPSEIACDNPGDGIGGTGCSVD